jgi:hypothetical protein
LGAVVVAALAAGLLATSGPPAPAPNPPGTFAFAVLGDAPYYPWEDLQFRLVLRDMDANDLAWVLHVGDIFWRPCRDALYERERSWFNHLRHPVVYTPGDNEWTDCWEPGSGEFAPLERLKRLREILFADPGRSLGGTPMSVTSQGGRGPYAEFVENVRWTYRGIVFATVNLPGSQNGLERFPEWTEADAEASRRRTAAAAEWLRETFASAESLHAGAVVVAFHANPGFEEPPDDPYRAAYEPFIQVLEEETERFGRPVLVVQGDDHEYLVDHPLVRRTTGRRLTNLTRMQVPGSPEVGWVRVTVTPGEAPAFAFSEWVAPWWKYW